MTERTTKAYSRGDADAYYGRPPKPHIWMDALGRQVVEAADMTKAEIEAYWQGFNENPSDQKLWW